uniref:Uncharacterized protein n=1 Tax=Panagrolaimus sp. ES5 TaxID=591445 RepID=A0AC34F8C0_9BILA
MKRSFMAAEEETNTVEKQPRKLHPFNFLLSAIDENGGSSSNTVDLSINAFNLNKTLEEINNDKESAADLPSLNVSLINSVTTDLSAENADLKNEIKDLKRDLIYLQKRHSDVLKIQGNFTEKEMKRISKVYSQKNHNFQRAKTAEERVEVLEAQILKCQEMVKNKDIQRIEVQHQLNNALKQIQEEEKAKEEALFDVDELQIEMKKLREVVENRDNLISNMTNQFNGANASKAEDTVTIEKLQQTILTKEKAIERFQRCLEKAYESAENLKDEKRETASENERFKICNNELRDASKAAKEKMHKLEAQLKEVQAQLFQKQNDSETSNENDSLMAKVSEFREIIKEKNQQIAQLQKDKNVGQVFANAELEKTKTELKLNEGKYADVTQNLNQMLEKYNEMQLKKDKEILFLVEEKKKLVAKIETMETKMDDLMAENSLIITEKEIFEAELANSKKAEQQKAAELLNEKAEHEKTKKKYETFSKKSKEFIEKAHASTKQESFRASEAASKAEKMEAKFLQCQTQLTNEIEGCLKLEFQVKNLTEQLGDDIVANEKAKNETEALKIELSKMRDEFLKAVEQSNEFKRKYYGIENGMKNERENARIKYEKLEENNKNLIIALQKLKSESDVSKKEWQENVTELQQFIEKLSAFCKK